MPIVLARVQLLIDGGDGALAGLEQVAIENDGGDVADDDDGGDDVVDAEESYFDGRLKVSAVAVVR